MVPVSAWVQLGERETHSNLNMASLMQRMADSNRRWEERVTRQEEVRGTPKNTGHSNYPRLSYIPSKKKLPRLEGKSLEEIQTLLERVWSWFTGWQRGHCGGHQKLLKYALWNLPEISLKYWRKPFYGEVSLPYIIDQRLCEGNLLVVGASHCRNQELRQLSAMSWHWKSYAPVQEPNAREAAHTAKA